MLSSLHQLRRPLPDKSTATLVSVIRISSSGDESRSTKKPPLSVIRQFCLNTALCENAIVAGCCALDRRLLRGTSSVCGSVASSYSEINHGTSMAKTSTSNMMELYITAREHKMNHISITAACLWISVFIRKLTVRETSYRPENCMADLDPRLCESDLKSSTLKKSWGSGYHRSEVKRSL